MKNSRQWVDKDWSPIAEFGVSSKKSNACGKHDLCVSDLLKNRLGYGARERRFALFPVADEVG